MKTKYNSTNRTYHTQNSSAKSNSKNAETAAASIPITLICLIARFSDTCSLIKKCQGYANSFKGKHFPS